LQSRISAPRCAPVSPVTLVPPADLQPSTMTHPQDRIGAAKGAARTRLYSPIRHGVRRVAARLCPKQHPQALMRARARPSVSGGSLGSRRRVGPKCCTPSSRLGGLWSARKCAARGGRC